MTSAPSEVEDDHRLACYHEAGHAVVAVRSGFRMDECTVNARCEGNTKVDECELPVSDLDFGERCMRVLAAGPVAQVGFSGCGGGWIAGSGQGDLSEVTKQADLLWAWKEIDPSLTLTRIWSEAADLVAAHWPAIEAVADVLYSDGKISPERVSELVNGSA